MGGFSGPSVNKGNTENSRGNFERERNDVRGTCDGETISPPGFSGESVVEEQTEASVRRSKKANKNQGPKRFGSPIKQSVKEISRDEDIADLNELALETYRQKLAILKRDTSKLLETRLGLLERQFFRRKFGCDALDLSRPWDAK